MSYCTPCNTLYNKTGLFWLHYLVFMFTEKRTKKNHLEDIVADHLQKRSYLKDRIFSLKKNHIFGKKKLYIFLFTENMIFNSICSFYQKEKLSIKNKNKNPKLNKRERIQCNRLPYQPSKRSNKNNTIQWANTRGIDFCYKTKVQLKNYLSNRKRQILSPV